MTETVESITTGKGATVKVLIKIPLKYILNGEINGLDILGLMLHIILVGVKQSQHAEHTGECYLTLVNFKNMNLIEMEKTLQIPTEFSKKFRTKGIKSNEMRSNLRDRQ